MVQVYKAWQVLKKVILQIIFHWQHMHIQFNGLQIQYVGSSMKPARTADQVPSEKGCT